ncbi:hypothetical protein [Nocardiopsis sp. L17-MgMaSL7]|uniref:hypothetical protein n=1 Tax=Nocardiopsis sp. L17-MgMaSL7 TaxID=1938893 RepID=UPI000D71950C|nr:hypothetical protein [Nocardiopsis sp. L17-MgMaSL7]PWV58082.1 hypothetical protein BDW27_101319 [Nocardiopsis sp. L17-MgMaSL7]
MTPRNQNLLRGAAGVAAAMALTGCTFVQDTFQVGEREFTYPTSAEAEESNESFRFQGFLPDDATDVRLIAQLDGHASVMRWTSPTVFASEHCTETAVTSEPELEADWLPESLPTDGFACSGWTVVRSEDTQIAWTNSEDG